MKKGKNSKTVFFITIILILGFVFRIIGLNWDQNQHLHPDERFLSMVLIDIKLPSSFSEYLNPNISPLNPYNNNYPFFVYGSFPLNLVKFISEIFKINSYDQINLLGRLITIFIDTAIILLIFLISSKIFNKKTGLIAAFLYSTSVFPIQLSHFYTVDPFLNFFILLTFYLLILLKNKSKTFLKIILISLIFGIALACKISAIYFLPIIFIYFVYFFIKTPKKFFLFGFIFIAVTAISFRFNQPQAFSSGNFLNWNINTNFIDNIKELKSYDKNYFYPPGIQWLKTTPILFPLKNIILWGLGFPTNIFFIFSTIYVFLFLIRNRNTKHFYLLSILFWVVFLISYQGAQSVTTMRYFLPIYPFIAINSAFFINTVFSRSKVFKNKIFLILVIFVILIYPISFISIYLKDHSRVSASKWIYQNIPVGSTIAVEYWDDILPLSIGKNSTYEYQIEELNVADQEDELKMSNLKSQLAASDYLILSSNRFYLPIPKNYDIFPKTSKYYQSIFDGSLGFKKIAEFSSYPCFPPFGKSLFCINDTLIAEEAFTVYDHPKVYIFEKSSSY